MATLTSVSQSIVSAEGGTKLTLLGTFPVGVPLYLHIGPLGNANDPVCWSGTPGQGSALYSVSNGAAVQAYTPKLPPGGPYALYLQSPQDGNHCSLAAALTVLPAQFRTAVYSLRSLFPPHWAAGPRALTSEELP